MSKNRWKLIGAVLLAFALLAASCGDDDSSDTSDDTADDTTDETTTTAAGDDTGDDSGDDTAGDGGEATGVLEFRPLDAGGALTVEALSSGDIDVALLFTTDSSIATNGWVLLEDDMGLQQIENLAPVIRSDANTPEVEAVLDAVSAPLTTAELTELNRQVNEDLREPADVAADWLEAQGITPWDGDTTDASLAVGSTNFFEQEIVAELYAIALESAGATIDRKFQLGAREVVAPAIESGEIDLYPEYLGSYTIYVDDTATVPSDAAAAVEQLNELVADLGLVVLTAAPAEDRNGLVVTQETADQYGLVVTSDLADVPDVLQFGGPPECPEREFCAIGLTEVYGLTIEL